MWSRGDVVALRDIWFDAVWRAVAAIVVEDTPRRAVFWVPKGSASTYPVDEHRREVRLPRPGVRLETRRTSRPIVVVCDEGAPWTLWLFFAEVGELGWWYVNFERCLGRSPTAYDSVDHKLDLIVRPDGSLEWKDEDELEQAARLDLVDAEAVRRDARRALAERPWPTGWEGFRPDPEWPIPELPAGWEVVVPTRPPPT